MNSALTGNAEKLPDGTRIYPEDLSLQGNTHTKLIVPKTMGLMFNVCGWVDSIKVFEEPEEEAKRSAVIELDTM